MKRLLRRPTVAVATASLLAVGLAAVPVTVAQAAPTDLVISEYVEGTSLAQMIDAGTHVEPGQLMHLVLELLAILEYLHGRVPPILHRDIKPSNIIVRPNGYPAIVDFGAVRRVFLSADESGSTIAGTYGYMPYEQYMGQASPSSGTGLMCRDS